MTTEKKSIATGLVLAFLGSIAFSGKAIIVKLAYRHGVDAVTLIMYRMLFALPFFVVMAWWAGRGQPAFVCRAGDKLPVEWQADTFASYLLMPKAIVVAAWKDWRGNLDPVVLADLPPVPVADGRDAANATLDRFSKPLAERFEVSAEAMRIRLEKLGLLMRERPNTLF